MNKAERKNLATPDETRNFPNGKLELVNVGGSTIGKVTFEPGWKWSTSIKPIAKTESCQVNHSIYVFSGRMHVVMDDGTTLEIGPGDAVSIPPGHDGWVLGNEPCVGLDFSGAKTYATK